MYMHNAENVKVFVLSPIYSAITASAFGNLGHSRVPAQAVTFNKLSNQQTARIFPP